MNKTHVFPAHVCTEPLEVVRRMVYERHKLDAAARATGTTNHVLSRQLNPSDDSTHLSLARAAAIEDYFDADDLAECFAARRGGLFVKLPALPAGAAGRNLIEDFAKIALEFSDVSAEFGRMLADGVVNPAEADRLHKEMRELWAACERLMLSAREAEVKPAPGNLRVAKA